MTPHERLASLAVAAAFAGAASSAVAGGFAIGTQSGSGTGNAFAGGAAAADDASVAWSNPAGMTLLPAGRQVTAAGHILKPSFKFQNTGSTGAFAVPGTGEGGDGGDWALVPNAFFTTDINPKLRLGLAVNAPFGLKTDYDAGWRGRLTALKSDVKSINLNPSVAYKVSDTVSIGVGVSVQMLKAELTSDLSLLGVGLFTLKADDVGYGFNAGIMVQATPSTRIGASYRSTIKYELEGNATFGLAAGNALVKADLEVPDSASLSVFSVVSPKWEVMADVTWTGWSSVKRLDVICRSTSATCGAVGAPILGVAPTILFNWRDTWRFGVGANYKMNNQTKFRFGIALDETPTNDVDRTSRLPDQDRTWVAVGVQHRVSKAGVLDAGYAHEFIRDASVNNVTGAGAVIGRFKNRADILSFQYSHSF